MIIKWKTSEGIIKKAIEKQFFHFIEILYILWKWFLMILNIFLLFGIIQLDKF